MCEYNVKWPGGWSDLRSVCKKSTKSLILLFVWSIFSIFSEMSRQLLSELSLNLVQLFNHCGSRPTTIINYFVLSTNMKILASQNLKLRCLYHDIS